MRIYAVSGPLRAVVVDARIKSEPREATDMTRRRGTDRIRRRRLGGGDSQDDEQTTEDESDTESEDSGDSEPTISEDEIPWILRRSSVNDERVQKSVFLRQKVLDAEEEFIETLEDELGEEVYKSDAREAALVAALEHPVMVCDVLRSWGYDLN